MAQSADASDDGMKQLNQETGVISWSELVRHFARGVVVTVSANLDLVEAASCMARDDTEQLQAWLDANYVRRASDDDARDWTQRNPEFWCIVTAPWVLVQERTDARPRVVH
jgi:hypothetical protein